MKTLLLADIHLTSPINFIKKKSKEGIERIIFLGDVNKAKLLEEFISFNMPKISLVGNHEYPFIDSFKTGKIHPSIDYLPIKDHEIQEEYKKWHSSPKLREYALLPNFKFIECLEDKKIAYAHGLLGCFEENKEKSPELWGGLNASEGRISYPLLKHNFNIMKKEDYWILFRGHDHQKSLFSMISNQNPHDAWIHEGNLTSKKSGSSILDKNRIYVITVGAFCWGDYMVFDSANNELFWDRIGE